jgi:membrane protein DedA with SNARE-associated domain
LIQQYGVFIIALLVFAGELGLPTGIALEVALLLAGSYAIHSFPALIGAIILVSVADILGTTVLHLISRTGGRHAMLWLLRHQNTWQHDVLDRWKQRLGGRVVMLVFMVRILPLVRMYISIGSGILAIRFKDFLKGAIPAAFVWVGVPMAIGYLFREQVHEFAAEYTYAAYAILFVLPAFGVISGITGWVYRGGFLQARLHRGRSALGFTVAAIGLAYLIVKTWPLGEALAHGLAAISSRPINPWLPVLAALALALLTMAVIDLRTASHARQPDIPRRRLPITELATTIVWMSLVGGIGVIVIGIELHYLVL